MYSAGSPADALSTRSLPLVDSLVLQKPYQMVELRAAVEQAFGACQMVTEFPIENPDAGIPTAADPVPYRSRNFSPRMPAICSI